VVIVVISLIDVKDAAGSHEGMKGSRLAERDRQSRRAEEPIFSERSETQCRENWRGRAALRP
jgi:hypothetical protein